METDTHPATAAEHAPGGTCHRRSRRHCLGCTHHRRRPVRLAGVLLAGLAVLIALAAALRADRGPRTADPATAGRVPAASAPAAPPPTAPAAGRVPSAPPTGSRTPSASTAPPAEAGARSRPRPGATATSGQPAADDDATGTLRAGDRGPAVAELQRLLFGQGFTYVTVTGDYDAATVRAVAQLQQDRDLTGDPPGVYGPRTRAALTSDS